MKLVKSLFILLLFIFPLGAIGRVELGGGVNLLLNDVIVGFITLAWVGKKIFKRESFKRTPLMKPVLLFFAAAILSLIIAIPNLAPQEVFVSSLYLVRWITYAALYFVVVDFDKLFKQKLIAGLLLSGTITAVIGLSQYFLYPNLRNLFYLGWDEHLFRLFSSLLDPNFAGGIFVLTFLLAISEFSLARSHLAKLALLVSAAASFASLLLTYSRGSFLSFVVGVLTLLVLSGQKKLATLVVFLFIAGIFLLPKNLGGEGVWLLRTASIEARFASSREALAIFQEYPVFGVGFNAYRYAREQQGFATTNEFGEIHSAAGTDNCFLFVLATTGIVGFVAYSYLWVYIIKFSQRNPLILATIVAIFVHAFFVNSLFYPWIMEWMWILIGTTKAQKSP